MESMENGISLFQPPLGFRRLGDMPFISHLPISPTLSKEPTPLECRKLVAYFIGFLKEFHCLQGFRYREFSIGISPTGISPIGISSIGIFPIG